VRVLYYHQHFSTPDGATGNRSYAFARRLVEHGHRVTLVCGSYGGGNTGLRQAFRHGRRAGEVDGIQVIEYRLPYANADNLLRRGATFLRFSLHSLVPALRMDYDVLVASTTPLTVGIPGIAAKLLRRKPFVFEVRDLWPELPRALGLANPVVLAAMGWLERAAYRASDAAIGLAPGIVEGIARYGMPPARLHMIPNASNIDAFAAAEPARIPGLRDDEIAAVFSGSHGIANGLDAVLDAAAVLAARGNRKIRLVFIGGGKLKPHLQRRAHEESLDNCLFLDPVPKTTLIAYLKGADIGLQVLKNVPEFYYGTSPNKFFDYLAAGLPVLTNYPGWVADLIGRNDCGVVTPPDDSEAFAAALETLADPATRRRLGANSRRLAEAEFDRTRLADAFVDVLEAAARRGS
jgi:glycosyltransferase involved in cell wall biosynthesis